MSNKQGFAKPLRGFVDEQLDDRLNYLKCQIFTGFPNQVYDRSEKLSVLKRKEGTSPKNNQVNVKGNLLTIFQSNSKLKIPAFETKSKICLISTSVNNLSHGAS